MNFSKYKNQKSHQHYLANGNRRKIKHCHTKQLLPKHVQQFTIMNISGVIIKKVKKSVQLWARVLTTLEEVEHKTPTFITCYNIII